MNRPFGIVYDALGRSSGFALDAGYDVAYAFDMFGRFHSVSSSVSLAVQYSRLADTDLLEATTFTLGSSTFDVRRSYESGRSLITSVENAFGETVISRYDYANDELGRRTAISRSRQAFADLPVRDVYGYNDRSEVTSARRTLTDTHSQEVRGFSYDYAYDPIGNRLTSTEYDHENNTLVSSYTATALNQYEQRTVPGYVGVRGTATNTATVTVNGNPTWRLDDYFYGGDSADNSLGAIMKQLAITAVYNPPGTNDPDVVTSATGRVFVAKTPEQFTYDDDGNLTKDGRFTYTWNGENRLIGVTTRDDLPVAVPRVMVEYAYDHQGRMVWKQISTNATILSSRTLLWDGYNIVQETICDQQSPITNSYIWGLDLSGGLQGAGGVGGLLAEVKDGVPYLAACDANGNVTEYLSADGTAAAHYEYSPFGEIVVQSGDLAASFTHRFSTKPWCSVTGLSEYEFRKYSPSMGRWLSRDPIRDLAFVLIFVVGDASRHHDILANSPEGVHYLRMQALTNRRKSSFSRYKDYPQGFALHYGFCKNAPMQYHDPLGDAIPPPLAGCLAAGAAGGIGGGIGGWLGSGFRIRGACCGFVGGAVSGCTQGALCSPPTALCPVSGCIGGFLGSVSLQLCMEGKALNNKCAWYQTIMSTALSCIPAYFGDAAGVKEKLVMWLLGFDVETLASLCYQ